METSPGGAHSMFPWSNTHLILPQGTQRTSTLTLFRVLTFPQIPPTCFNLFSWLLFTCLLFSGQRKSTLNPFLSFKISSFYMFPFFSVCSKLDQHRHLPEGAQGYGVCPCGFVYYTLHALSLSLPPFQGRGHVNFFNLPLHKPAT